ncbi:KR domain-containing protein [Bacillus velezensis]|nr:KR domain-containing protein [Bacillus velezensis]
MRAALLLNISGRTSQIEQRQSDSFSALNSGTATINGIIHVAGILRDSFLVNKSLSDFTDVLKPKVYGTIWLDELTKDEDLDFLFSFLLFPLMEMPAKVTMRTQIILWTVLQCFDPSSPETEKPFQSIGRY